MIKIPDSEYYELKRERPKTFLFKDFELIGGEIGGFEIQYSYNYRAVDGCCFMIFGKKIKRRAGPKKAKLRLMILDWTNKKRLNLYHVYFTTKAQYHTFIEDFTYINRPRRNYTPWT